MYRQTFSGNKQSRLASYSIHGNIQLLNVSNRTIEKNGNEIQYVHSPFSERKQKNGNNDNTVRQSKNLTELSKSLSSSSNQLSLTHGSISILSSSETSHNRNSSSLNQFALKQPYSNPNPIRKEESILSQMPEPSTRRRNRHTEYPPYYITINSTIDNISFNKTYTHPKDPSNITFFPWNDDGIDYSATCSKLLSIIKSFSGPIIVNSGLRGGLGHKFLSLYYSLTIALVLRRPFYCILILSFFLYIVDWDDIYMNNLNSCFQSLRFTGGFYSLIHSFTYRS